MMRDPRIQDRQEETDKAPNKKYKSGNNQQENSSVSLSSIRCPQKKLKQSTWAISCLLTEKEKIMTADNVLHSNSAKITIFVNHEKMHRN